MNQSPLPPPSGVICPNCGATQSEKIAYCASCGAALPRAKSGGTLALIGKIVVLFVLFTGAMGLGALGACITILGGVSNGSSVSLANSVALPLFIISGVLGLLGVGCIVFWARREK